MSAAIYLHPTLCSKPALASELARELHGEWVVHGDRCILAPVKSDWWHRVAVKAAQIVEGK